LMRARVGVISGSRCGQEIINVCSLSVDIVQCLSPIYLATVPGQLMDSRVHSCWAVRLSFWKSAKAHEGRVILLQFDERLAIGGNC
jgi:hypothetical protein